MARATRIDPSEIFTKAEIARLRARSDMKGAGAVIGCWAIIFVAMALFALWPNPLSLLAAVVIIAGRQLGLAILSHDAAHGILTKSHRLNEFLGQWMTGLALGFDMYAYRSYHLKHHARTQQPDDPDLPLSAKFPVTPASLRRKLWRDISGQTFFQQRRVQLVSGFGDKGAPISTRLATARKRLGGFALVQLVLLALLTAAGKPHYFLLFWLLPMATVFMVILRVRNIAEHAVVPDNDDPFRHARTTLADPVTRFLLAPYNVNYHVEHHLLMWVPFYNLPEMHRLLIDKGYGERMEIRRGYPEVLRLAATGAL